MKLQISFCYRWNYGREAARVVEEVFTNKNIRDEIIKLSLQDASYGYFIVKINDKIVFNNKDNHRMLNKGEIIKLIQEVWYAKSIYKTP